MPQSTFFNPQNLPSRLQLPIFQGALSLHEPLRLAPLLRPHFAQNMATIPLHCSICPKKPNFSDVSHLLTHIASKGHLSHYYKVKVRSSNEEASRRLIEAYDKWYSDWQVEDLMSQRMNLKDKKRPRLRSSASTGRTSQAASRPTTRTRQKTSLNAFDPRLSEQPVKIEARPTPPLQQQSQIYAPSFPRSVAPRMHLWPTARSNTYGSWRRTFENYSEDGSDISDPPRLFSVPEIPLPSTVDDDNDDSMISEAAKLKGVFWPGMDIFDSATPEMRRKRNQKKDVSVVEQLETNSLEVEPTELIFTPLGSLKKQRKISGLVESSSPVKSDPSPRKCYRPALAEMGPYHPRANYQPARFSLADSHAVYRDEQLEFDLSYGTHNSKRKRGFEIFQDQEVSFAHPATLTYLTSEFQYAHQPEPPQPEPQQLPHDNFGFDFKPFPDPFRHDSFVQDEKENFDVAAYQQAGYMQHSNIPFQPWQGIGGQDMSNNNFWANGLVSGMVNAPAYGTYKLDDGDVEDDDDATISAPPSELS